MSGWTRALRVDESADASGTASYSQEHRLVSRSSVGPATGFSSYRPGSCIEELQVFRRVASFRDLSRFRFGTFWAVLLILALTFSCYQALAQSLLKDSPDKSNNGSGSETAVARRFGGGASHLKRWQLFRGNGVAIQESTGKKGRAADDGLVRLGGASQDLSAARTPFRLRARGRNRGRFN